MKTDVLIVGAGPTGLTIATILARYGVDFQIIDSDPGATTDSRATIVHSRTLELWDKLRLTDEVVQNGVQTHRVALMRNGKEFAELPFITENLETPYPYSLIYSQPQTERMLLRDLERRGHKVQWQTRFESLEQHQDGVKVTVKRNDSVTETIEAHWLVGSDGAKSGVREALGLTFEGATHPQVAFIADAELEAPERYRERVNLNYFREGYVGFIPMKSDNQRLYRVFGVLPNELEEKMAAQWKEGVSPEDLTYIFQNRLKTPVRVLKSMDTGLYRLHRRMVERYRVGRCFLAGDAAHIHTPAGGQGMNTGIQDGINLAWKLALVVKGIAKPDLLNSYETERKAVAEAVLKGTDVAFVVEASKNPFMQFVNNYLVPIFVRIGSRFEAFRRVGSRIFMQAWINYRDSPGILEALPDAKGVKAGDRLPFGLVDAGESRGQTTYDLTRGLDFHLFVFEGSRAYVNLATQQQAINELFNQYCQPAHIHTISHEDKELHQQFGATEPMLYLVRPDGHIGFRGKANNARGLETYLNLIFK
jgi:2-polyprenyl-6-methoxyphenol hydroxylase-like FAD-dependent oxidoreductase